MRNLLPTQPKANKHPRSCSLKEQYCICAGKWPSLKAFVRMTNAILWNCLELLQFWAHDPASTEPLSVEEFTWSPGGCNIEKSDKVVGCSSHNSHGSLPNIFWFSHTPACKKRLRKCQHSKCKTSVQKSTVYNRNKIQIFPPQAPRPKISG